MYNLVYISLMWFRTLDGANILWLRSPYIRVGRKSHSLSILSLKNTLHLKKYKFMPSEWKLCFYLCFKYLSTNIRQANNIYGFLHQKSKIKPLKEVTLPPQFPTPTWMMLPLNLKKWESGGNVLMRNVINLYISKISYFKPSSGYLCSLRCNGLSFTSIFF